MRIDLGLFSLGFIGHLGLLYYNFFFKILVHNFFFWAFSFYLKASIYC